tara:strand:+ start:92 stop:949 length:858 start_codon:yes stop_codon:yes gene_type:complete
MEPYRLPETQWTGFRERCRRIIFFADKPEERAFDVVLIVTIVLSVLTVMLESVASIQEHYGEYLRILEWVFTGLFTIEYFMRLYTSSRPLRYAKSFFGVVDLIAILPSFLDLLFPGARYLMSVRALRTLRIFRVLKMANYIGEANTLTRAIRASARKILVFVLSVLTLVTILGAAMYLIEGAENGFTSIPKSVYWAIVTLTTVGYGDISPSTPLGQVLASVVMIMGYGIIAVPTGIVTAEITRANTEGRQIRNCLSCNHGDHDEQAGFCKMCGGQLEARAQSGKR